MADRSQTFTSGLSVYVYGGLHEVLTLPATVLLAKTFLQCSFKSNGMFLDISADKQSNEHNPHRTRLKNDCKGHGSCNIRLPLH